MLYSADDANTVEVHTKKLFMILDVLSKETPGITEKDRLQMIERMVFEATEAFSHKDEQDKNSFLSILRALDYVVEVKTESDVFKSNERIQSAYRQLSEAKASSVFEKGLEKLKHLRETIWQAVP